MLVLEPTRELAIQVAQELGSICAAHRMKVLAVFGGASFEMQSRAINQGVHIIVATPGRALDHITRRSIDLSSVRHVVLDEGDTMLEMGFQKSVEAILSNVKVPGEESRKLAQASLEEETSFDDDSVDDYSDDDEDEEEEDDFMALLRDDKVAVAKPKVSSGRAVQMLLFSATMPGWICGLTDKHMESPVFLDAVQEGETRLAPTIQHLAIRLPPVGDRTEAVGKFMEDVILTKGAGGQTIVFTNTKEEADRLAASEFFGQLRTQVIHGDISQNTRQTTLKGFKDGVIEVLVATDVAARGLDIAGVDLVVHTAPPMDSDTYVHRSGRTGRAGRNGTSVVLYIGSEDRKLSMYESALNFKFEKVGPPSAKQISEACSVLAAKRISNINPTVAKLFSAHARELIEAATPEGGSPSAEDMEELVSKCLAAISNRQSIASRSMLTGEENLVTIQVEAVFKNGTTPETTRDWTKLITGVLHRSLGLEDMKFGKMTMARGPNRNLCVLVDMPTEQAMEVLEMVENTKLPQGVTLVPCEVLPPLISERSDRYGGGGSSSRYGGGGGGGYSGGGRGGYSGGGGGRDFGGRSSGSRDGDSRDRKYGGAPSGGGGSWSRTSSGGASSGAPPRRSNWP